MNLEQAKLLVDKLGKLMDERAPTTYSEMDVNISGIMLLNQQERTDLHNAKMFIQSQDAAIRSEARERNLQRRAARQRS